MSKGKPFYQDRYDYVSPLRPERSLSAGELYISMIRIPCASEGAGLVIYIIQSAVQEPEALQF